MNEQLDIDKRREIVELVRKIEYLYDEMIERIDENPFLTDRPHLFMPKPQKQILREKAMEWKIQQLNNIEEYVRSVK